MQEVWLQQTIWTILPPLIARALALWTKEVYFSLLVGIFSGALMFANFNPLGALETTFTIMGEKVGGNINIIIFLVLLGMLVALMNKSGATRAYGRWAVRSIKSQRPSSINTGLHEFCSPSLSVSCPWPAVFQQ